MATSISAKMKTWFERVKKRRAAAYLTKLIAEGTVNGADTGYTLTKAAVILKLGTAAAIATILGTALAAAAWPIIIAGGIAAIFYVASQAKEQYDLDREEDKKAEIKFGLENEIEKIKSEMDLRLRVAIKNRPGSEEYFNINDLNNSSLLKLILRNYLKALGVINVDPASEDFENKLQRKRKSLNGPLPGQEGMIRLIEARIGLHRTHPAFLSKLKGLFEDEEKKDSNAKKITVDDQFYARLAKAFKLRWNPSFTFISAPAKPEKPKSFLEKHIPFYAKIKRSPRYKKAKQWIKRGMFWVHRANTANSYVVGSLVISGQIVSATAIAGKIVFAAAISASLMPIVIPLLLAGIAFGILSGTASLLYSRFVQRSTKEEDTKLENSIKEHREAYRLLYVLNRQRTKKYEDKTSLAKTEPFWFPPDVQKIPIPEVTKAGQARRKANTISRGIFLGSAGGLIGIAIGGVSMTLLSIFMATAFGITIALPIIGIPILVCTCVAGPLAILFARRYGFWHGGIAHKNGELEVQRIKKIAQLTDDCKQRIGATKLAQYITNSKQELVEKLMAAYIELARHTAFPSAPRSGERPPILDDALSKKEKILLQIEDATGIRRTRNDVTGLPMNRDDDFYNQLSLYLQKDKKTALRANAQTSAFKSAILGKSYQVNAEPSLLPSSSRIKAGITWTNRTMVQKYLFTFLAAVGIAIPLGFGLFGPGALVLIGLVGVTVMTAYFVHKACEYRAERNLAKLAETKAKLPLIEAIVKTTEKAEIAAKQKRDVAPIQEDLEIEQKVDDREAVKSVIASLMERPTPKKKHVVASEFFVKNAKNVGDDSQRSAASARFSGREEDYDYLLPASFAKGLRSNKAASDQTNAANVPSVTVHVS